MNVIYICTRRHVKLARSTLLAGQRQDPFAGMRTSEHFVVLWRRRVRRKRHEANAELRQDQVQAHQHR